MYDMGWTILWYFSLVDLMALAHSHWGLVMHINVCSSVLDHRFLYIFPCLFNVIAENFFFLIVSTQRCSLKLLWYILTCRYRVYMEFDWHQPITMREKIYYYMGYIQIIYTFSIKRNGNKQEIILGLFNEHGVAKLVSGLWPVCVITST